MPGELGAEDGGYAALQEHFLANTEDYSSYRRGVFLPGLPFSWRFVLVRNILVPSFAIGLVIRISFWHTLRMRKNYLGSMTWWFNWISS